MKTADEKKHIEAYNNLVRVFELPQLDNVRILRHLIYMKDDIQPLVDGNSKSKVNFDCNTFYFRLYICFFGNDANSRGQ